MAMVGFFAVFHGFAHGAEMPEDASSASYAAGFMLATALLHMDGIAIGKIGANAPRVTQGLGALDAAAERRRNIERLVAQRATCALPAFIRSAGIVQRAVAKSISFHVASV